MKLVYDFPFKGEVYVWHAPRSGIYKLEVWGAEGGKHTGIGQKNINQAFNNGISSGGYGGYSVGFIYAKRGLPLYIYVGGKGNDETEPSVNSYGGWNGGGSGLGYGTYSHFPKGGGSTDIATVYSDVTLDSSLRYVRSIESYNSRLIVAGGGGAGCVLTGGKNIRNGGHGGGYIGNDDGTGMRSSIGYGGTQKEGGQCYNADSCIGGIYGMGSGYGHKFDGGSGGGGYYGGGESRDSGAGGGSGFIGNVTSLPNFIKTMYCYECRESNDPETFTISTSSVSSKPIPNTAKSGDGHARITLLYADSISNKPIKSHLSLPLLIPIINRNKTP